MWWLFFQWRDETNARLDKLEAKVDMLERHVNEIVVCLKASVDKLKEKSLSKRLHPSDC